MRKEDIPKFDDIDLKTLFYAVKRSYQNAENYYYEAELLYRLRSYGHSLTLSTLGLEELGKSIAYLFLIIEKIFVGTKKCVL